MHQESFSFDDERTIDERFALLLERSPEVYAEFCRLAWRIRAAGHKRYSAKGLFEVMRFHRTIDSRPGEAFKLNNIYTSRFARKLVEDDPSFDGFFETRVLKSR